MSYKKLFKFYVLIAVIMLLAPVPGKAVPEEDFFFTPKPQSFEIRSSDVEIRSGGPRVDQGQRGLTFEGLDLSEEMEAGEAEERAFEEAVKLMVDGELMPAVVAFHELLQNPAASVYHHQAEHHLAKSLFELRFLYSSLQRFNRILVMGPSHSQFHNSLEWLFHIAQEMVNEAGILEYVAAYADYQFPEQYRSELSYLLARFHFARGRALLEAEMDQEADQAFRSATRLLRDVRNDSEIYPKAVFLEGLHNYIIGRHQQALEKFQDVVRMLNPQRGRFRDETVRQLAFMQLARIHFEHEQPTNSAFYYRRITRGSEQWLQSLFESSWAYYIMGDYQRSLGAMVTLHSPFFVHEYYPESFILKAVIYYENCRYPEVKSIVEEFQNLYGPVQEELTRLVESRMTSVEYYELLSDIQTGRWERRPQASREVLQRILGAALTDREFAAVNEAVKEVEKEIDALRDGPAVLVRSRLVTELVRGLEELRGDLMEKAGLMARAKLYSEKESLTELLSQGLRVVFETTEREREFLEQQIQEGGRLDVVREYAYSVAVSDEELYWPYRREYWRDELGNFHYTLTRGCRDDIAAVSRDRR